MFVPGKIVRRNGGVNVFSLTHSMRIMALATCIAGVLVCGSAGLTNADVSSPQAQDNNLGNVPLGRPFHNWDAVAQCESGGRWHIATGNGYYGGLQFSPRTWHSFGGVGNPALASREYQIMIAERVLAKQGIKAWPVCGPRLYGLPARRQPKGIFPTWNFPILHSIFPWLPF